MARIKRAISLLLIWCMALGLLPNIAFAAADAASFTDVKGTDWFYNDVAYVCEHEMMNGTSATAFSPEVATTRAMIVTILHRLEGTPSATSAAGFSDVAEGQYYTEAVAWAAENDIVNGYGNGLFGPDDTITREQMAAILYRYADYKGYDMAADADISIFTDADKIHSYATVAMQWANAKGLITGVTATTLVPQGNATRAQVAAILNRFCKNIVPADQQSDIPIEEIKSHTVAFNLNYGKNDTYKTATVNDGDTTEKPSDPTRTQYKFKGWYKEKSGGKVFDFTTKITDDITLYAHWISTSSGGSGGSGGGSSSSGSRPSGGNNPSGGNTGDSVTKYTVTFDSNGGSAVASQTINSGSRATEPSEPTRNGYQFIGWYTSIGTLGNKYNFNTAVTSDLTLYASWQPKKIITSPGLYMTPPEDGHIVTDSKTGVKFVNNEMIIHAKSGIERSSIISLLEPYNGEIVGEIPSSNSYQVRFSGEYTYDELTELQSIFDDGAVISWTSTNFVHEIEREYLPEEDDDLDRPKNDSKIPDGFYIKSGIPWGFEAIHAPEAWEYRNYMSPVNIGIFDANFYEHKDILWEKGKLYHNDGKPTSNIPEEAVHGTHVAGIIAAIQNNKKGLTGVTPNEIGNDGRAKFKLHGFNCDGFDTKDYQKKGFSCKTTFGFESAFSKLIDEDGCKVLNFSIATETDHSITASLGDADPQKKEKEVIEKKANEIALYLANLIKKGKEFVICVAAGNQNDKCVSKKFTGYYEQEENCQNNEKDIICTIHEHGGILAKYSNFLSAINKESDYKKVYDRIIVVGACGKSTDKNHTIYYSDFSNLGDRVDIVAPGEYVYSTGIAEDSTPIYYWNSGTSQATPHVAGVAAMLFSLNKNFSGAEVKRIIIDTADKGRVARYDPNNPEDSNSAAAYKCTNMLNAAAAVKAARPALGIVNGRVLNSANIPLGSVTLKFRSGTNTTSGTYIMDPEDSTKPLEVKTDKDGYYTTDKLFKAGVKNDFTAEASKENYEPGYVNFTVKSTGGVNLVPDIQLISAQSEYSISGIVQSSDPAATLTNVQVKLIDSTNSYLKDDNGNDLILVLNLNDEGTVGTFTHMLPSGSYMVEVSGAGFKTETKYFYVPTPEMQQLDITLEPNSSDDPPPVIIVASGECGKNGNNLTWTLYDNGLLQISGQGDMADFNSAPPWDEHKDKIKSVKIEDGATTVGKNAFILHKNLTSVSLPNTITQINNFAFKFCNSLTQISLPANLKSIENEAFYSCGITDITIPNGVTKLGSYCFYNCNFTSVNIPYGITTLDHVFCDCKKLTSVTIPESVTSIIAAFHNCSRLNEVNIPNSVTRIGASTFEDCSDLREITIPDSATAIGSSAFKSCSLTEITIPTSVTSIGAHAFANCPISSVTIPNRVTKLENETFFGCGNLTDVKLPNTITSIGSQTFSKCGFKTITLPDSLKSIGFSAFNDCDSLTSIVIPDSVTSIDSQVFSGCLMLNSVTLSAGLTSISGSLFINCEKLAEIVIPASVTEIGPAAFKNCTALTTVRYGGSTTDKDNLTIKSDNDPLVNATWNFGGE